MDMNNPVINNLEEALLECHDAARKGYAVAKDNLDSIRHDIMEISDDLSQCLSALESSQIRTKDLGKQIRGQLKKLFAEIDGQVNSYFQILEKQRKNLDNFSITLFGRTMAGKSTLMEILTNGDGSSIGKGSQRTTRDVRSYQWKGMIVTDVPGVAAFGGQQDEVVANESAKNADLILFMITDDAPQNVEAKCLAGILDFGKPVIGICNVKTAIDDERYMKSFLRKPEAPFDQKRLLGIYRQFNQFLTSYNPYAHLMFVPAHLRARYLSGQKEYGEQKKALMDASRFRDVESKIIQAVAGNGKFYRIRSFIDGSIVPMQYLIDRMLEFSSQNSACGRALVSKRRQLKFWVQQFRTDGDARIQYCITQITEQLRGEVPGFAESHYEDKDAGEKWDQLVKRQNINATVQRLQHQLFSDCQRKLSEITDELRRDFSFVSEYARKHQISMEEIHDYKQMCQFGTGIATGVLAIGELVVGGSLVLGPLSIPLAATSIGVFLIGSLFENLFDSHEEKARKARASLSESLYESISKMENILTRRVKGWFHKELLGRQIYDLMNDLSSVTEIMFYLADAQRNLAWRLNDKQKKLNRKLITEALLQLNATEYFEYIRDTARMPNSATMLLISPDIIIPQGVCHKLKKLLGEEILFVVDTQNDFSILRQAIGKECNSNKIHIENKLGVAHVPLNEFNKKTKMRASLAQQLTGLHLQDL